MTRPRRDSPSGSRVSSWTAGTGGWKFGSSGRTRTCDQSVTSSPVFLLGSDYLITRLTNQVRVSGACEVLSVRVPQPLVSARSCLPMTLRQASLRIPLPRSSRTAGKASLNSPDFSTTVSRGSCNPASISDSRRHNEPRIRRSVCRLLAAMMRLSLQPTALPTELPRNTIVGFCSPMVKAERDHNIIPMSINSSRRPLFRVLKLKIL